MMNIIKPKDFNVDMINLGPKVNNYGGKTVYMNLVYLIRILNLNQ